MKKILAIILTVALMCSLFAGCGSSAPQEAAPAVPEKPATVEDLTSDVAQGTASAASEGDDKLVVVAISQDCAPLSPFAGGKDIRSYVQHQLYQPLFRYDGYGGDLVPCVGKSYNQVDEYNCEVEIYDCVYDSDGNHLTASDVKFSLETALASGNYARIADIESVEVVSDYIVNIHFKNSLNTVGVLENCLTETYMVTEKAYNKTEDHLATISCGTGRYEIAEYIEGASVLVTKREDYWQKDESLITKYDQANVGAIRYDIITDASSRTVGMQGGAIQFNAFLNANDYVFFEDGGENADDFNILATKTPYLYAYTFNLHEDSAMYNKNLRLAFAHAINRADVGVAAFGPGAIEAHADASATYVGYQSEWDSGDFYDGQDFLEYNPELATEYLNKYLEETGKKLSDVKIRIYVSGMAGMDVCATLAQAYLAAIGIDDVEVKVLDNATMTETKKDPTAWEVTFFVGYASKYAASNWKLMYDRRDQSDNRAYSDLYDDVLQEKLEKVITVDGYTPENIIDFNNYIEENALELPVCGLYQRLVYPSYVLECLTDARGIPMPGACVYDWTLAG